MIVKDSPVSQVLDKERRQTMLNNKGQEIGFKCSYSFFKSFIEEPEEAYTGDDKEDTPDDNKGGD